jgi:hypothetical protein
MQIPRWRGRSELTPRGAYRHDSQPGIPIDGRLRSLETLGELSLNKRDDRESQLHTEGKAAIGLMRRVEAGNSEEATDMDNLSSSGV